MFKKRDNIKEVEEGKFLEPKFDENGLIPVITADFKNGEKALGTSVATCRVHW